MIPQSHQRKKMKTITMNFVSFIAVLCCCIVSFECNDLNVTLSNINVAVGGNLNFTLDTKSIPSGVTNIPCGYRKGLTFTKFASYWITPKTFYIATTANHYSGRVTVTKRNIVTISKIKFSDEKDKFLCETITGPSTVKKSQEIELKSVYALPVIGSNPLNSSVTARQGTHKAVICDVKSRPMSTIYWTYPSEIIGISTQTVKIVGDYSISTGTFNITNPQMSMDKKRISCTGKTQFGSTPVQTTMLRVEYLPKIQTFSVSPSKFILGGNIMFKCSAVGNPPVTNYKLYLNDKLVGNPSSGILTVNASDCKYSGKYKCIPENSLGAGTPKIITKEFEDTITLTSAGLISKTVNVGASETLTCSAISCPTPIIEWRKNGVSINKNGSYLLLANITTNEAGVYSCHAKNTKKSISSSMTLIVNYKTDMIDFTTPTTTILNGDSVVFTCKSNGHPAPNYQIYKIVNSVETLLSNTSTTVYTIPKINYKDYAANYKATIKCMPRNVLGNGPAKTITLNIQVPPMLNMAFTPSVISEFSDTTLKCIVIAANPQPKMTIYSPNGEVVDATKGSKTFLKATRARHGKYRCVADNGVPGSQNTKTVSLTVRYKPDMIDFTTPKTTILNGDSVVFTCKSNGHPAPIYKISKILNSVETVLSNTSTSMYTIPKINYKDFAAKNHKATIKCLPHNMLGNGPAKSIILNIQVKAASTAEEASNYALLGGISGGIMLFLIVAVALFITINERKRPRQKRLSKTDKGHAEALL